MAYVGETPWHGLGNELTPQQPIEIWAEQSGMSFQILETPVRFMAESAGPLGSIKTFADQKVLYRSDTQDALSVVSNRYQVVQPSEVLEFYRDLTQIAGYELETAGVLKGGKKFWALARTGQSPPSRGTISSRATCCSPRPVTGHSPPRRHRPRFGWSATTR